MLMVTYTMLSISKRDWSRQGCPKRWRVCFGFNMLVCGREKRYALDFKILAGRRSVLYSPFSDHIIDGHCRQKQELHGWSMFHSRSWGRPINTTVITAQGKKITKRRSWSRSHNMGHTPSSTPGYRRLIIEWRRVNGHDMRSSYLHQSTRRLLCWEFHHLKISLFCIWCSNWAPKRSANRPTRGSRRLHSSRPAEPIEYLTSHPCKRCIERSTNRPKRLATVSGFDRYPTRCYRKLRWLLLAQSLLRHPLLKFVPLLNGFS